MKLLVYIFILIKILPSVFGGNILIFNLVPVPSFTKLLDSILNVLSDQHNITIYTNLESKYSQPNITVVKINVAPIKTSYMEGLFNKLCNTGPFQITFNSTMSLKESYVNAIYNDESIKSLLSTKVKYDLLITCMTLSELVYQFAHVLRVPFIQIAQTIMAPRSNDAVGNPAFLTTNYNVICFERSLAFFNRVKIYLQNTVVHLVYFYSYMPYLNSITKKFFPPGTPLIEEILFNVSLVVTNVNSALGYVRQNPPHVIDIGGIFCKPPQALSPDLEEFITGAGEHGVIYFSFGSTIQMTLPEDRKRLLANVFGKLPQRVLWKTNEDIKDLTANVRTAKWFAQQDVLGHNNTRLFIMQAGILSMQESVYHGVPVLTIPIAHDQYMNSILANQLGYGEIIDLCELTEEILLNNIQNMINNPKYKQNVKRVSRLMKEELENVNEKLLNGINYVMRHNGNPIIHQLPKKFTGFQKLDVDIVVFLVLSCMLFSICIIYLLFILVKFAKKLLKLSIKVKIL